MESLRNRRRAAPANLNMKNTRRLYPPRAIAVAQRPVSNTTDFDDTDFELSDTEDEDESPRMSMDSLGYSSNSSLSTPDLPTPDHAPKAPFNFQPGEKGIKGPSGPHLFRASMSSAGSAPSTAEIDVYFEKSPVQSQFPGSAVATQATETPNRFMFSPRTPKVFSTVHPDVSHVDEEEIRNWSPSQVAHWMYIAGYDDSTIDKFMINDITGGVLLTLQIDDLKELDIMSFGKRHQLMGSINHLRNTMRKTPLVPEFDLPPSPQRSPRRSRRSYDMSVSPSGEVLSSAKDGNKVTPGEFVSIVGVEQLLPKPHNCSKGENCAKYQRRQRQIEKIMAENPGAVFLPGGSIMTGNPGNPENARNMLRPESDAQPSVIASSDVFGPAQEAPRLSELSEEALSEVEKDDPKERMKKFLDYQHVESPIKPEPEPIEDEEQFAVPPQSAPATMSSAQPAPSMLSPPTSQMPRVAANLRNLPKLTIPTDSDSDDLTTATATAQRTITPNMAKQMYGSPTVTQEHGSFSNAHDYRQGTPFSEMDAPITAIPHGPVARDVSQSVPPDMRFGDTFPQDAQEPISHSASTRPQMTAPLHCVRKGRRPLTPIEAPSDLDATPRIPNKGANLTINTSLASDPNVTRSGWMKKRKTTRLLRHEWQDAHFTLRGTNLAMHRDESNAHRNSQALDSIDVDDYAVACSSLATSSKLTAALKKSVLRNGNNPNKDDAAFAFSLVPTPKDTEPKKAASLFSHSHNGKSHHFAVKNREERIDWMRELMLAKALKKGRDGGSEMQVNGNFI